MGAAGDRVQAGADRSAGARLARWARAVRASTLRRLAAVPPGAEGEAPGPGAMSVADLAQHLIDADDWLQRKLRRPELAAMQARAGAAAIASRGDWSRLLGELERSGRRREELLRSLDGEALERRLPDERFGGEVSVWWIVVRGTLEHEAHHRGQIAAALRSAGCSAEEAP